MKKRTWLDVLMKHSRFPEFRYRREFTEFMMQNIIAECATKALKIKRKYDLLGKSIKPEKAVDICLSEGIYIDCEAENSRGNEKSWFSALDDETFKYVLWFSPKLSLKEGKELVLRGFATLQFPETFDLYPPSDAEEFTSLDELAENPPLMLAVLKTDLLVAMLLSNETEAELLELQEKTVEAKQT